MKYCTPANGETVERDDIPDSLVQAGVYVPVVEAPESNASKHPEQTPKRPKSQR